MPIRRFLAAAALAACGGGPTPAPAAPTTAAVAASPADTRGCTPGSAAWNEVAAVRAQVDADVVPVAARAAGVLRMVISDGQHVDAGAVIAEMDDADDAARLAAARADLEAAKAQAEAADAQVAIARSAPAGTPPAARPRRQATTASPMRVEAAAASVARANAILANAELDYARAKKLHDAGAIRLEALEAALSSRQAARAAADVAAANLVVAREQSGLSGAGGTEARGPRQPGVPADQSLAGAALARDLAHARVQAARAALDIAQLELGKTRITSPVAGSIRQVRAHEGQRIQPGTPLLLVVSDQTYVNARFEETQRDRMAPGDPVEISIAALGGRVLRGRVESVSAPSSTMTPGEATRKTIDAAGTVPVRVLWNDGQNLADVRVGVAAQVCLHH